MTKVEESHEDVLYTYEPRPDEFLFGVPQRDLTREDVERMPVRRIQEAVATGLYKPVNEKHSKADEGAKK